MFTNFVKICTNGVRIPKLGIACFSIIVIDFTLRESLFHRTFLSQTDRKGEIALTQKLTKNIIRAINAIFSCFFFLNALGI